MLTSCVDGQVAGMTPEEAFTTPHTAEFVRAVMREDYDEADKLLRQGVNVNAEGGEGLTPLFWAMVAERNPDVEKLEYLLKAGANPNHQEPKYHGSAIYIAVDTNQPKLLKLFLKYGGNPSLVGRGHFGEDWSLLSIAALNGQDEIIKILVAAGADVNWLDEQGFSAAFRAIGSGRYDLAAYLLEHGLTAGLDKLERGAKGRVVSSNMQAWKDKVILMIQERRAAQAKN